MKIDNLIRELRREITPDQVVEEIFSRYQSKKPKAIPAIRQKPRKKGDGSSHDPAHPNTEEA